VTLEIQQIPRTRLDEYAAVPITFEVTSALLLEEIAGGLGGFRVRETPVVPHYVKDFDAYPDGGPERWPDRFDIENWGIFLATEDGEALGGAAVAWRSPGVYMLEGRKDIAVLWDIRVAPARRRNGVGTALFERVVDWCRERECTRLKVETQNVNVVACRFYARQGCIITAFDRHAYIGVPESEEVMLIWSLPLQAR
jgi:GNAT superfamily N-acetyltransferase